MSEFKVNFIDKKYYLHLGAGMPEYRKGNCGCSRDIYFKLNIKNLL